MRKQVFSVIMLTLTVVVAPYATAASAVSSHKAVALTKATPAYSLRAAATTMPLVTAGAPLQEAGFAGFDADGDDEVKKQSYVPALFSAIIPGTGELTLGYTWRGLALIALDAAAWAGYFSNRSDGLDSREAFESFADANWDHDKWINDHLATAEMVAGGATPPISFEELDTYGRTQWGAQWPGYHSYASKEDEKLNYYENIGKYDWFISGWADWDMQAAEMDTDLRTEYRAMRKKSNDQLEDADRFLYVSLGLRVFSLVETVFLVNKKNKHIDADQNQKTSYRLDFKPTGIRSGEVAFQFNFR